MKKFTLFCVLVIIFQSCTMTKGVYDSSLKSTDPFKFSFTGTQPEFETSIKRLMVQNGFIINESDKDAGILATQFKELPEDEKYNTNSSVLIGVNVSSQKGRMVFIYKNENQKVTFELSSYLTVNAQYQKNTLSESEIAGGAEKLPQGHPLNMKYRNLLLKDSRFSIN